jgi:hypothetical protein
MVMVLIINVVSISVISSCDQEGGRVVPRLSCPIAGVLGRGLLNGDGDSLWVRLGTL